MNIYDYFDYRKFLRDFYNKSKSENSYFSYRYMGRKVGLDPGYLVKVIQGKYHVTLPKVPLFAKLCHFSDVEQKYFETLIRFNKAKTEKDTKYYFEKLISFKGVKRQNVAPYQYEFYQKWYYSAVRSIIGIFNFTGDYEKLGSFLSPPISTKEAKEAVELLLKLEFITRDDSGGYHLCDPLISTGDEWRSIAVRQFQRETIKLAGESLERHNKEIRDISTVTVSVAKDDMEDLRELIKDFRSNVLKFAQDTEVPDSVYQLNIQLLPLTDTDKDSL